MCENKMELPRPPIEVILDMTGLKQGLISLYIRNFLKDTIFSLVKGRASTSAERKCHSVVTDEGWVMIFCGSQFLLIK